MDWENRGAARSKPRRIAALQCTKELWNRKRIETNHHAFGREACNAHRY